jgi:hypothetical protein
MAAMKIDRLSAESGLSKSMRLAILAFFTAIGSPAEAQQIQNLPDARMKIQAELKASQKVLEETTGVIRDIQRLNGIIQDLKTPPGELAAAINEATDAYLKQRRVIEDAQKKFKSD